MAYADTQVYTLDAATTALADVVAALITHFTAAPGRWQLVSAASPVAGEALAIEAKTSSVNQIAIRRSSTTQLVARVDPGKGITDVGDSSTPATASASASPDCNTGTITGISTRFFVVEHDDAVTILLQNAAKTATIICLHLGRVLVPLRESDAALGMDGHAALVGVPSDDFTSGVNNWFNTSIQSNGSRVRGFDTGGAAAWYQSFWPVSLDNGGSAYSAGSADGLVLSPRPIMVQAQETNSTSDCVVGVTKWVASAPFTTLLAAQVPLKLLESPLADDEAWMYIRHTTAVTGVVVSWERGVTPT